MSLFYPTIYRHRITDVTSEQLHSMNIQAILLDVDNTLTTHDAPDLTDGVMQWLRERQAEGFQLIIVSNNAQERVAPFAAKLGLPYVARAHKPLSFGYRIAARQLNIPLKACVAIGDQIFTDILGANLSGIPSILLEPIQAEVDQKFIVFKRKIERLLMKNKRQILRKENDYAE